MWFLSGTLLAISLSMDALGIGISYGLRNVKISFVPKFIISFISLLFTAAAIGIGSMILSFLPDYLAKLLGSGMLAMLGIGVIFQALHQNNKDKPQKEKTLHSWCLDFKSLGISFKIIYDSSKNFERKKLNSIGIKEALYLGVALSIDSFGAGISTAVSGVNNFFVPIMVGVCQFIFLSLGLLGGKKLTLFKKINAKVFMILSGIILISLACIRYFL